MNNDIKYRLGRDTENEEEKVGVKTKLLRL